jgi:hypothetical protein
MRPRRQGQQVQHARVSGHRYPHGESRSRFFLTLKHKHEAKLTSSFPFASVLQRSRRAHRPQRRSLFWHPRRPSLLDVRSYGHCPYSCRTCCYIFFLLSGSSTLIASRSPRCRPPLSLSGSTQPGLASRFPPLDLLHERVPIPPRPAKVLPPVSGCSPPRSSSSSTDLSTFPRL